MTIRQGQLLRSDQAKPFRVQHKAPCSDCPWARKSIKGWTGPNSTATWLSVARDYWHPIACHTRRIARGVLMAISGETHGHWECAGAAIFRANTKVFYYEHKPLLKLPANDITVFATPKEFEDHHGDGITWRNS